MCLLTRLFPLRFYTVSSYKDKNKVETKTGFFTSKWVNNKSFVVPPTRGSERSIPQAICKASLTILTNLDCVLHYAMIAICYDISKEFLPFISIHTVSFFSRFSRKDIYSISTLYMEFSAKTLRLHFPLNFRDIRTLSSGS